MGKVWTIKVVWEFWFGHSKCHFLWCENGHFCQKCPSLRPKKWHFKWPNQNSKTTFIVQTFPKYGPNDVYFMGAILAMFWFCWFSGLFLPIFPCKIGKIWNAEKKAEDVLQSKNARKEIHSKIQFYIIKFFGIEIGKK